VSGSAPIRLHRPGSVALSTLPPLALYVHLPWCLKKCPYCDFNSHQNTGVVPEARYIDALIADLEAALPQVWGRRVSSVFIGGGTPSLFSPQGIDRLLADVRARLPLEAGCEVTLEANPGTFERERFRAFRAAGVTRLSIGVQSFDDGALRAIGRVHDAAQARAAVEEAAATFDTWNLDLMYALPYAPPHLSLYHLTLEPNTVFATRPPEHLPDDDLAAQMLDVVTERAAAAGLARYEVSAYARPGHRCVHNLNYWQFGDYLGIGAGAHGKLSFADRILRQTRWRDPETYMQRTLEGRAVSNESPVAASQLPFEFMLNTLRLREGFDLALYGERTGQSLSTLAAQLDRAEAQGLIERAHGRVRPTARGFDFLSDLQQTFLP
jgi:putative oxygen-independent coproporphyrinogen III oxidase